MIKYVEVVNKATKEPYLETLLSLQGVTVYHSISEEIKHCGLGSRIRDMEAEWRLKVLLISY